jgi:hypothetical protein
VNSNKKNFKYKIRTVSGITYKTEADIENLIENPEHSKLVDGDRSIIAYSSSVEWIYCEPIEKKWYSHVGFFDEVKDGMIHRYKGLETRWDTKVNVNTFHIESFIEL